MHNGIDPMHKIYAQIAVASKCPHMAKPFSSWGYKSESDCLYVQMEFCKIRSLQDVWNIEISIKKNERHQFTAHPNQSLPSAQLALDQIITAMIA